MPGGVNDPRLLFDRFRCWEHFCVSVFSHVVAHLSVLIPTSEINTEYSSSLAEQFALRSLFRPSVAP
jgi:hypothetical protein